MLKDHSQSGEPADVLVRRQQLSARLMLLKLRLVVMEVDLQHLKAHGPFLARAQGLTARTVFP